VKGQGKLNMHVIFESVLMLFMKISPCWQNYSLPKFSHFLKTQSSFSVPNVTAIFRQSSQACYFEWQVYSIVNRTSRWTPLEVDRRDG